MADPVQTRAKDKRRAEALRANLKRRKEQARERETPAAELRGEKLGDPVLAPDSANAVGRIKNR